AEWDKYPDAPRVDMTDTRILIEDIARAASSLGSSGVDPTSALEAAEPGAFLDGDIHLSPKGHEVVAAELVRALRTPVPAPLPLPGLPEGRSRVPLPSELRYATQVGDVATRNAGCEAVSVREWVRVRCRHRGAIAPTGMRIESGDASEAMTLVTRDATSVLAPLVEGGTLRATAIFADGRRSIEIAWPQGRHSPVVRFGRLEAEGAPLTEDPRVERACACMARVERDLYGTSDGCGGLYGSLHDACFETYPSDCSKLVACLRGDVSAVPRCPEGMAHVGAAARCAPLCDASRPCEEGTTCRDWRRARVCM
ncbi:MAG: hypothetical protein H5U40_07945, partial [Polyangiaceae bacterium]|nr:hypothetical protein [Polyangiaceae bacterium]